MINAVFTPTPEAVGWTKAVVATLTESGGVGGLEGKMLDRPELKTAE
ncbi:hypothetical protein ACO2RV_22075 [Ancylobacter sp. VNQ12]